MTSEDKVKIILGLHEAIDKWTGDFSEEFDFGWFSPDTTWYIATAAAQVLFAQSESQEYAVREGFLNKGD